MKFQLASENVRRSLVALTVADRVPPSRRAISPTESPGPKSARCTPWDKTSAVPSRMRKNRPPPSPSATTSAPAGNDISFPASRILFSCFCGRSRNNSAACYAAMISLAIRVTFQVGTTISKSTSGGHVSNRCGRSGRAIARPPRVVVEETAATRNPGAHSAEHFHRRHLPVQPRLLGAGCPLATVAYRRSCRMSRRLWDFPP